VISQVIVASFEDVGDLQQSKEKDEHRTQEH